MYQQSCKLIHWLCPIDMCDMLTATGAHTPTMPLVHCHNTVMLLHNQNRHGMTFCCLILGGLARCLLQSNMPVMNTGRCTSHMPTRLTMQTGAARRHRGNHNSHQCRCDLEDFWSRGKQDATEAGCGKELQFTHGRIGWQPQF